MNSTTVPPKDQGHSEREVRFEHSKDFVPILRQCQASLLVTTYQAGKVVVLGTDANGLSLSFHNFSQAMGAALHPRQIAIGSKTQIWFLRSTPELAGRAPATQGYDGCFLARSSHVTDDIHIHEMAWRGEELWFVNTRFSCLCSLEGNYSFAPRWRPRFITELAAEDRCHLNGLCLDQGRIRYVTAMAQTNHAQGWREVKGTDGCLIDVESGETVARGFAMPHSPRCYGQRLWVLDSGRGELVTVDPRTGKFETVSRQPGYTRGMDFAGAYAFVGLSRIRETSTFNDIPLAEQRESLKCAVVAIDLRTGKRLAYFEFLTGVEEIFDVKVLPRLRNPFLAGPQALEEGRGSIWYAPPKRDWPTRLSTSPLPTSSPAPSPARSPAPSPDRSPTRPVDAEAWQLYQRGAELFERDQYEAAVACFQQAIARQPEFVEAHVNGGVALQYLGRIEDSIASLERALQLRAEMPAAHMNLAMSLFLRGDLERAWREYEWRRKCPHFDHTRDSIELAPAWDGGSLAGRRLLCFGEQGIGDEIMFASCFPDLQSRAEHCTLACAPRLAPLFRRSFPGCRVISAEILHDPVRSGQLREEIDLQIASGSATGFLRRRLDDFPRGEAYLTADATLVAKWRARLEPLGDALKVGISWRGGKEPDEQRRRSTRLPQWIPLLETPGAAFINLQYGDCSAELTQLKQQTGVRVLDWLDADPCRDLDDFAAQISALDLVVSVDNSSVHLAGALGVPTWMLLSFPSSSCWRWPVSGEDSRWYSSLRLLRKQEGGWEELLERVAEEISQRTRSVSSQS